MIQTLIPAYRPSLSAQPLSSASIASREPNPTVIDPASISSANEQGQQKSRTSAQNDSSSQSSDAPTYEDPRKSLKKDQGESTEAKRRELIEQMDIQQLSARDREVRAHERAHAAVGGQYASAPTYQYERGPDGVNYAIAGEVSISTGAVAGDPQATIEKAQIVRRAALAPAEPSPQDRQVAAEAMKMELDARAQLSLLQQQARQEQAEAIGEKTLESSNTDSADAIAPMGAQEPVEATDQNEGEIQNLSEMRSANDRLTEFFGQKFMSSNILQDSSAGDLIDEIA